MVISKLAAAIAAEVPETYRRRIIFAGRFDPLGLHHLRIIHALIKERDAIREADPHHAAAITIWPICAYGDKVQSVAPVHVKAMLKLALDGLEVEYEMHDLDFPQFPSPMIDMQKKFVVAPSTSMREAYLSPLFEPSVLTATWHVIGMDNVDNIAKWEAGSMLWKHGRFIIVPRAGYAPKALPPKHHILELEGGLDGSATSIRELMASGGDWEHFVPSAVAAYIKKHGLYKPKPKKKRRRSR